MDSLKNATQGSQSQASAGSQICLSLIRLRVSLRLGRANSADQRSEKPPFGLHTKPNDPTCVGTGAI